MNRSPLLLSLLSALLAFGTVGYGSPEPLTVPGKVFSVVLMLFGIGLMLYLLTLLAEYLLRTVTDPDTQRRRKEKKLQSFHDHTIVCGYGQVGEAVATALRGSRAHRRRG